jgi:periplasmic protein CpxP/Spy
MRDAIGRVAPLSRPATHWMRVVALSTLLVAGAAATLLAHAESRWGPGSDGPGMMMFGGPPERMAHMIDRMLDGLDATEAQRNQIKQIAMSAAADVKTQRDAVRSLRDQALQIFAAPNIDPAAAESVRQRMLAQHDQAGKRMLQAMLDAAKVLTPDQRAKMGARMKERQAEMNDRMQRMRQADRPQSSAPAPQK